MSTKVKLEPACFVIKSFEEVGRAIAYMHKHHANAVCAGKPLVVSINQKQQDRSKAQNRLYWLWLTQWAKKQGTDKDYEHNFLNAHCWRVFIFVMMLLNTETRTTR